MPILFIDNKPYEVSSGKNLLEVCLTLGLDLPYFCWHPALGSVGACRQCAVKIYNDENDKKGRLIMSCMEPVTNNQRISITDTDAHEFRENVIGWLMTNHPHDCAVCDEGGSCHLQDMTVMTGHAHRKFNYKKRTYINQDLGPFINHEMNRCIQCYRCVRFYKDYAGGRDLDAFASRNQVYFGRHEDGALENEFSGNLAEVCPTGVFTDKTLKEHYTRKWDLTMAPSICQHCSLGCNIIAGERYGSLRMISNRYNGQVNGYFLCDRGRFGYEFVNAKDRIHEPILHDQSVTREKIIEEVTQSIQQDSVIGIGSPRASLESNFMLRELVGKENFYQGVSEREFKLSSLAVRILREGPIRAPSMKEVEEADAIFILGEDITNTAPMMALATRQAVRQKPRSIARSANIPDWHDAAVREVVQDEKGPLFIADVHVTKLDDVATQTFVATPDDLARLGFEVAHVLDNSAPGPGNLSEVQMKLAQQIAGALSAAKIPVIITGSSCGSEAILQAAANVAYALQKKNKEAGLVIALPECNSMGLSILGERHLQEAFQKMQTNKVNSVIVLENDLYRHARKGEVDGFLLNSKQVVVIDHSPTDTAKKAHVVLPAGTFAESDGTIVNNEGRAQRFFQVYEPAKAIQESWRWVMDMATRAGKATMSTWSNFDLITKAMVTEVADLKGSELVAPESSFRMVEQRIPREPHRYSGRTAMNADVAVSEAKPPEDPDSSMSYTMEGFRGQPPSSMIPFYWTPGWNSVQSVNKYQVEVGAALKGGDPGVLLLKPDQNRIPKYFDEMPKAFQPDSGRLWVVWLHHIFGSEELSARSASVAQRIPTPYVLMRTEDGEKLQLVEGQLVGLEMSGHSYKLPVKLSPVFPVGMAGLPQGLAGVPHTDLPAWGSLKK